MSTNNKKPMTQSTVTKSSTVTKTAVTLSLLGVAVAAAAGMLVVQERQAKQDRQDQQERYSPEQRQDVRTPEDKSEQKAEDLGVDERALTVDDIDVGTLRMAVPVVLRGSGYAGSTFGISVSGRGDVNGDSYPDLAVGDSGYDDGSNSGAVYVYYGANGPVTETADWEQLSSWSNSDFGSSVSLFGDVNGDSYDDLVVGARGYENGEASEGGAFVYLGSSGGLSATPDWTGEVNQAVAHFGQAVSYAGDVNGDSYDDVVVYAPGYDTTVDEDGDGLNIEDALDAGVVFVYFGSSSGLASTPNQEIATDVFNNNLEASIILASAGDVNGDGYSDIVIGDMDYSNGESSEGALFLYHGSSNGLVTSASWSTESDVANSHFGNSVASAGDVNGDGYDDVVVGSYDATHNESSEGFAFVYYGSASGLDSSTKWKVESNSAEAYFGMVVSGAGDVNNDGYDDVLVGAPGYQVAAAYGDTHAYGAAFVYRGTASGMIRRPLWSANGVIGMTFFGATVNGAGNINGKLSGDVAVAVEEYDDGTNSGPAVLVYTYLR